MNTSTYSIHAVFAAIIAVMLMACVPVVVKWVQADEWQIGAVRLLIASVGIFVWLRWKGFRWRLTRKQWGVMLLLGLVFAVHWFSYFKAIKLSTPSVAAIGVATFGVHLVLLSRWLLKQPITLMDWLALILAGVGLYLVIPELNWHSHFTQGLLWAVASGFLYACLPIIHQKSQDIPDDARAWGQFTFGLLPFAVGSVDSDWSLSVEDWQGLLFLGMVSTLVAHSLWVKATTALPGALTSLIYYLYVPVAMGLSVLIMNEPVTSNMVLGAIIIIAANALTLWVRWQKHLAKR